MSIHAISWVLKHSGATGSERLVLIALADKSEDDGSNCFPSVATLAQESRCSRRTVQSSLRKLEAAGRIRANGKGSKGQTNWTVVMQEGAQDSHPLNGGADHNEGGRNLRPEGAQSQRPNHPDPSIEPSSPPSDVDLVWEHFVEVFNPRNAEADEGQRKIIRDALKVATVEECNRCIDACFASDFHQRRGSGKVAGRKHNRISDILKPKRAGQYGSGYTQRERIDFWLDRAEEKPSPAGPTRDERDDYNLAMAMFESGEGPDPGPPPWEAAGRSDDLPWGDA